ncbi:MAG: flagellar basal body rod protein FlgB [Desulfobacteraceae bacterium]|nr:flagellar basal body rod protein FlgB [Desulfobacteraceae bacterium]
MPNSRIFGRTYEVLSNSLDISAKRHNLISSNIANMDTIGYKPKDLDFNKTLKRAMTKPVPPDMAHTHKKHFTGLSVNSSLMSGSNSEDVDIYHLDSVNIDTEMTNLVVNNIKYRTATEMLLRKMEKLRYAIREGGR